MTWPTQTYTPQINANAILGSMDGWYAPAQTAPAAPTIAPMDLASMTPANLDWGSNAQVMNQTFGTNNMAGNNIGTGQTFWGKAGNWLSNGNNLGTVVQGIGALTNAYLGFRQLSMAKDQLNFQKSSWAKNFANSVSTYNTSLEDRIRGRTSDYAGKENDVQSYLAKHKLKG